MKRLTLFQLARMRHLDLLALWFTLHPDTHNDPGIYAMGRASKENLIAAILAR